MLHGEAGIGKTALLLYARDHATGCTVTRVVGVEAEAELAFGGLHQLCAPYLDRLERLAAPQRVALETAFGMSAGPPPDRFLVGLAVLSLLADVAEERPVLCLVDDAQWLDQVSAQTLAFVARRLLAERVLMLFAIRDEAPGHPMRDLLQLSVEGLGEDEARALLDAVTPHRFDPRVRERILAEARGNPLALLELPRALTAAELANQTEGPDDAALTSQLERGFLARIRALTPASQRYLLVAAADPVGDPALQQRAAERLGIDAAAAAAEAEAADLVTLRSMVRFRHPLVRSAAYRSAAADERRAVHRALAEVTDADLDPDRLAWHRASAIAEPDEAVAGELERAAERARARGGVGAAGAFLTRSAQLTPEPALRGTRTLAAARAMSQAGAFDDALQLLDGARLTPLDEHEMIRADLVRGQVMFAGRGASAGLPLLLAAAARLETADPELARETYRDAMYAAFTAGQLPGGEGLETVSAAVLAMSPVAEPTRADLLLEGVARIYVDGYAAGVPLLQRAVTAYHQEGVSAADLGWLPLAARMAHNIWDFDAWTSIATALVDLARGLGALSLLPSALLLLASARMYAGDLETAAALADESITVGDVTGSGFFGRYANLVVVPWSGDEAATREAVREIVTDPFLSSEGKVLTATEWAAAVLNNGLERWDEAFVAAQRGAAYPQELGLSTWSMVELAEAAARLDRRDQAAGAVQHVRGMAEAARTDWALGTAAYVEALVAGGPEAEALHREAVDRLERSGMHMLGARSHLVLGEWLLAAGRRDEARGSLTTAYDRLTRAGAVAYAERARRALAATGAPTPAPARRPSAQAAESLTPQEAQIARLAAGGHTNPEIGAELYISAHTVEWHLRKVFAKLGVRSRRDIAAALSDR